jgi:hypothetical protein
MTVSMIQNVSDILRGSHFLHCSVGCGGVAKGAM